MYNKVIKRFNNFDVIKGTEMFLNRVSETEKSKPIFSVNIETGEITFDERKKYLGY